MDEYVRAARDRPEPWDRLREQRVLEGTLERLDKEDADQVPVVPRRSRLRWLIAAGVAGLLLVGGALTWMLLGRAEDPGARSSAQEATRAAPAPNPSVIRFADGSEAVVYPGGRVVVREQHATRILLDQLAGAALFRVTPNPERRFEVAAEGLTIRVVGTRFKVTILPAKWVRVEVERGLVEVEYEGQTVRLGTGDSLQVNRDALARVGVRLPAGPAPRGVAPADSLGQTPPRPAPRRRRPTVSPGPAMAVILPARPAATVAKAQKEERDWIAATMRQVDAARRAGRYAEAVRLIRGLIAKYPHNWRVSTAAFVLARIEHARRRYATAAKAYALYRRRSPSGPLAEDALAGEARARRAAGQRTLARGLARMYLKKYPRGTHAKAMRSVRDRR